MGQSFLPASSSRVRSSRATTTCQICQAVYAPSPAHRYLVQAPPVALESAFMSMGHFCFRCRRPACPSCWDEVHGICGACVEAAGLPFRSEPAPLAETLIAPSRRVQMFREDASDDPLLCLRPGRFSRPPSIDELTTRPGQRSSPSRSVAPPIRARKIAQNPDVSELATRPGRRHRRIGRRLFWSGVVVLTIFLLVLFAAWRFAAVDAFFVSTVHVDFRAEIAYLWHLMRDLWHGTKKGSREINVW